MKWQIINSGRLSGRENMDVDRQIFRSMEKGEADPTLRIYGWASPCISLGYSQDAPAEIDLKKAKALGWDVVKRPTGGGIVFHNEDEVTFSIAGRLDDPDLPQGLIPLYLYFAERVVAALREMGVEAEINKQKPETSNQKSGNRKQKAERRTQSTGIRLPTTTEKNPLCFASPTEYEITVDGRKLVGMAQRRGRRAFLIQGTIKADINAGDLERAVISAFTGQPKEVIYK